MANASTASATAAIADVCAKNFAYAIHAIRANVHTITIKMFRTILLLALSWHLYVIKFVEV
jgi:hypothetical protein